MSEKQPWPTEIRLRKNRTALLVRFDDGKDYDLSAELLRVLSPSAEVQGHSPEQRQTVPGKANVAITAIDPVGNYAVRLTFSTGTTPASSRGPISAISARIAKDCGEPIWPISKPRGSRASHCRVGKGAPPYPSAAAFAG